MKAQHENFVSWDEDAGCGGPQSTARAQPLPLAVALFLGPGDLCPPPGPRLPHGSWELGPRPRSRPLIAPRS